MFRNVQDRDKRTYIGFNSVMYDGLYYPKGARHVPRPNCLFADHKPLAGTPFHSMRQSLSRRLSYSNLYLYRSVLLDECCPTNDRGSLDDIEACLRAVGPKLYHAGVRVKVSRTTLAKANEQCDWRIYRDFVMVLKNRARMIYANQPPAPGGVRTSGKCNGV